jgi:hypothetical protein
MYGRVQEVSSSRAARIAGVEGITSSIAAVGAQLSA